MGIPIVAFAVGIPSSRRGSRGGLGIPESIHFYVKIPLRPSNFDRSTSAPLLSQCFLRTDLHLSKPCFVSTRCSSDDASRLH